MRETPEQLFQRATPPTAFKSARTAPPMIVGVGDCVYMVASALGFKTCGRCNKRRAWLNRRTPRWLARVLGGIVKHLVPHRR